MKVSGDDRWALVSSSRAVASSGASGTVLVTGSTVNVLASSASAPKTTSRACGQPPAPARTDGNSWIAGRQVNRSPDTSTSTRPGTASAVATAPLTSPADRGDNSPDTASTHASGPRRTCRTVRPEGSDDTSWPATSRRCPRSTLSCPSPRKPMQMVART
jgi:hypothetical protein